MEPLLKDTSNNQSLKSNYLSELWEKKQLPIAILAILAIVFHLLARFAYPHYSDQMNYPLLIALVFGGVPLVFDLARNLIRAEFGSDLLAGLSIVTAIFLEEYLAGTLVVLMLSGGEAIEDYAIVRASSVLDALAKRMPTVAHLRTDRGLKKISLDEIMIGDSIEILPHEICPVDGKVTAGHGVMDESYLTGEPYMLSKTPGSMVLSGSINGSSALTIQATRLAIDSRYAKIMQVMKESEQKRPKMRRLADQLGAAYTPLALAIALLAWALSGDVTRFLSVLVVATPCPLLIAIPVAIIGAISSAARRGIIVRDPAVLEKIDTCRTMILDKTGTLTYGRPTLADEHTVAGESSERLRTLVSSVCQYSKHPLSIAMTDFAKTENTLLLPAASIEEIPGQGLRGIVDSMHILITSRKHFSRDFPEQTHLLPEKSHGLEFIVVVEKSYAGTYVFRDELRRDGQVFLNHLKPNHSFNRIMLVSGDRESEVRYLADQVGIAEVYFEQSPEQKLAIVEKETKMAQTIFLGDGINDAPALMAATVGIALGQNSEVIGEASDAIIMDSSLKKVDEFLHISKRMRHIALQSAIGGMALSVVGMIVASFGYLPPVAGALTQELIDVVAVLNALRVAFLPKSLSDF